ncbi:MAG: hypothetical protein VX642_04335 [Bdellovibrionota bacterium]|nr:hypothetical protein [Bdellovibrionota bacterium]
MNRMTNLMNERNKYLVKYYNLNEREMVLFAQNNYESLDAFYETRQAILEVVAELDKKIDESLMTLTVKEVEAQEDDIAELLSSKDSIIEKILDQDLQLLSLIEKEKNRVMKEYMDTSLSKKAVGKYHSGAVKRTFEQEA